MEEGKARIDLMPISRFLKEYKRVPNLPLEYVLTGSTVGYPPALQRNLEELDRDEPVRPGRPASDTDRPPEPSFEIARKRRSPNKERNGGSRALDEAEAGHRAA
jgi:hypothetical protein